MIELNVVARGWRVIAGIQRAVELLQHSLGTVVAAVADVGRCCAAAAVVTRAVEVGGEGVRGAAAHHMLHVGCRHTVVGVLRFQRGHRVLAYGGVAGANEEVDLLIGDVRFVVNRTA